MTRSRIMRIVAGGLAVVASAGMLAACGEEEDAKDTGTDTAVEEQAEGDEAVAGDEEATDEEATEDSSESDEDASSEDE